MLGGQHRELVLRELEAREALRAGFRAGTFPLSPAQEITPEFYSTTLARTPKNRSLNRYVDIEPYNRGGVMVNSGGTEEPIYLNGNWVKEVQGGAWWLATQVGYFRAPCNLITNGQMYHQAPLPKTMHTFFSLCTSLTPAHQRIRTIVQLTANMERGMRKAHPYMPTQIGPRGTIYLKAAPTQPKIGVTLVDQIEETEAQCVKSTLRISLIPADSTIESESVDVHHFFFAAWPDHGVPNETRPIIKLVQMVDETNAANITAQPPVLVHCSAGVGRTGTFIAISSILRAFKMLPTRSVSPSPTDGGPPPFEAVSPLGKLPTSEDLVAREIDGLREMRTSMVQRREQVLFVYKAVAEALTAGYVN